MISLRFTTAFKRDYKRMQNQGGHSSTPKSLIIAIPFSGAQKIAFQILEGDSLASN
jgi:hypothetical protein